MHQPSLSELRTQFAQIEGVHFTERTSGLPEIHIENRFCEAVVSLQGGQVLSYTQKADGRDLLFCSKKAYFESGKGIKGGAPICWPWFGEHPDGLGAHGFARKTLWQADQITTDDCGVTEVTLSTCTTPETEQYWPYQAKLSTTIRLGKWLSISLCTTNLGPEPLPLTQAIHTYFQVADIKAVKVSGLESHAYYDKVQDFALTPPASARSRLRANSTASTKVRLSPSPFSTKALNVKLPSPARAAIAPLCGTHGSRNPLRWRILATTNSTICCALRQPMPQTMRAKLNPARVILWR